MSITIRDSQPLLSSLDRDALSSAAHSWPFDVHLLVENAGSREALDDAAHAAVTSPSVVVIAIDPQSHHIVTRFGTSTGVKPGDYDSIAKAGNAHFRSGEWVAGIEAVAVRAQASAQSRVAMSVSAEPVIVEQGLSFGAWCGLGLLFAVVVGCVVWAVRRMRKVSDNAERALQESRQQTPELMTRNIEEASWTNRFSANRAAEGATVTQRSIPVPNTAGANPPLPTTTSVTVTAGYGGGYGPVYGPGYGNNDLLTGMLIGEELSQPRERVIVEREVIREAPAPDAGGGDSSWSGSSSSFDSPSSDDSGGSSSSFDDGGGSGGGFDGGGFDSGGGGDSGW